MVFGVCCNPLACDAESKVSAAIYAHLDLTFLARESLFTMMLAFFSIATSCDTFFGGVTSVGSGFGWMVA